MNDSLYKRLLTEVSQYHGKLIAVSKTQTTPAILDLYRAGQRDFGENKVQELCSKQSQCPPDIRWHMIGHLQTNKVKQIIPFVYLIHSVDSTRLLLEIEKQASKIQRRVDCLLQLHIGEEESKFGFNETELRAFFASESYHHLKWVRICGLMGMASNTDRQEQVRMEFRSLKNLFDEIRASYFTQDASFSELSMGMSQDYPIALEEGSTLIRIGSLLFGARN